MKNKNYKDQLSELEIQILNALAINLSYHIDIWIRNKIKHPDYIDKELTNLRSKGLIQKRADWSNKHSLYRITRKGLVLLIK